MLLFMFTAIDTLMPLRRFYIACFAAIIRRVVAFHVFAS